MTFKRGILLILLFLLGIIACKQESGQQDSIIDDYTLSIPIGFTEPTIREDNPITQLKIDLGRQLFFDPILSRDTTISCGSCHHSKLAFSDNLAVTPGVEGKLGKRNAPSLSNLAWYPYFFAEGGSPNLEAQILGPLEDPNEMDFSIVKAIDRIKSNKQYVSAFNKAFGKGPSSYTLTRAIASFERSLVSGNSRFDQYYYQQNETALTDEEKLGFKLFTSKELMCSSCHSGFLFTDFSFQNIGLYDEYADIGRARLTLEEKDNGKFKVPTLRNIEVTGPYMHDGKLTTLDEIIEHYKGGGFDHPNRDPRIKPTLIRDVEKMALIAFLKSLTDEEFINTPH